jgi:hypothetical protein
MSDNMGRYQSENSANDPTILAFFNTFWYKNPCITDSLQARPYLSNIKIALLIGLDGILPSLSRDIFLNIPIIKTLFTTQPFNIRNLTISSYL